MVDVWHVKRAAWTRTTRVRRVLLCALAGCVASAFLQLFGWNVYYPCDDSQYDRTRKQLGTDEHQISAVHEKKPIKTWTRNQFTASNFEVAGVNLASYDGLGDAAPVHHFYEKPFELFEDFDLTSQITGNESWADLVRYRREAESKSLSFYSDKIARKRWLPTIGIPIPKPFILKYASELTETGHLEDEKKTILELLPVGVDYAAKPTHLTRAGGVWLVESHGEDNTTLTAHRGEKNITGQAHQIYGVIAKSLAKNLHKGPICGPHNKSCVVENVKPGVMIEELFSNPVEFKVLTIWGRMWAAYDDSLVHFVLRNGTILDWNGDMNEQLPEWIDWQRVVDMAERLGAHKDMFRTDIFVGVPESSWSEGATEEEQQAAFQYVVSENAVSPNLGSHESHDLINEWGRLWLAGYMIGNYRTIPNDEVPTEFLEKGSLSVQA